MGTARVSLVIIGALAAVTSGCIKSMLVSGQIKGTRDGAVAVDTLSDFEVARAVAYAGLGQFEGMHEIAPTNEDALFLLTKGWTATSFGFIEDDYEIAADADDETRAEYHRARARAAIGKSSRRSCQNCSLWGRPVTTKYGNQPDRRPGPRSL